MRMEVGADLNLHIWDCFFSLPGTLNDRNNRNASHHFPDIWKGKFPKYQPRMTIAGNTICWSHYLADGIYPAFRIFVRTIADDATRKEKTLSKGRRECKRTWSGSSAFCFKSFISLRLQECCGNLTICN